MQLFIYAVFCAASGVAAYWFLLRPWLSRQPLLADVYRFLDRQEAGVIARLRVSLSGLKRKLFANLVMLASVIVGVHDVLLPILGVVDITPFLPPAVVPYVPLITAVLGAIFRYLNSISPQPVGQVNPEVVAETTETPIEEVAEVTAPDPIVAIPQPDPPVAAQAG